MVGRVMAKCLRCGAGSEWLKGKVPSVPKPRKRNQYVWVLTGSVHYENTDVLGIYRTKLRAARAQAADTGNWDDYDITRMVIE